MVERELLGLIDLDLGNLGVVIREDLEGVVGTCCLVVAGDVIDIGALGACGLGADGGFAHEDVLDNGCRGSFTAGDFDGTDSEVEAMELEGGVLLAEDDVLVLTVVVETVAIACWREGDGVAAVGVGLGCGLLLGVDAEHIVGEAEGDVFA